MRAFAALVLLTACGSGPTTSSATSPRVPPPASPVELERPVAPPAEPLSFEDIAFEQQWSFVAPNLGQFDSHLLPEAELGRHLPAKARAAYQAIETRRSAYRKIAFPASGASPNPNAVKRARAALEKAIDHADATLEAELDKRPSGALGIALARVRQLDRLGNRAHSARPLRYGSILQDAKSQRALDPLWAAVQATRASEELGRYARVELAHHSMSSARAREAGPLLQEVLSVAPRDQAPLLHFRLGVVHSLDGRHDAAAQSFRKAHVGLATSSKLSRQRLIAAELFARYRAEQYERVLDLASEAWNERAKPTPLEPGPNPPPPPPPPPPKSAPKPELVSGPRTAAILGVLRADSGDYPDLFSSSPFHVVIGEPQLIRLATDAVERLGREPSKLQPETLRAEVLSELAFRAYYRGDRAGAKTHGLAAEKLDRDASLGALRVLRRLALDEGDQERVKALDDAIAQARSWRGYGSGIERSFLQARDRAKSDAQPPPSVTERAVRSLVRLCLEPIHARFPTSSRRDQTIAEVALTAKVFAEGRVELEPILAASELAPATRDFYTCTTQLAPKLLVHATSSARVHVAIKSLIPPAGIGLGESFGYGGLGIGTGGSIGRGSGAGFGRRSGGLRPKPKPPAPKPTTP